MESFSTERVIYLLRNWLANTITSDEEQELFTWIATDPDPVLLQQHVINLVEEETRSFDQVDWERIYQQALSAAKEKEQPATIPVRRLWRRWVAAASVLAILALGTYFFIFHNKANSPVAINQPITNDIAAPHSNRAMITLANGTIVYLDSADNGTLATQQNITLIKTEDGKIKYSTVAPSLSAGGVVYNTLTNPRGSKVIDMILSDGSHVWLNAASSITYPIAFTGNERKVKITGEAYFEVKHNAQQPFTVTANGVEVHDIGTSFNVNAYDDEDELKITLVDGSVSVLTTPSLSTGGKVVLKPGQQAVARLPLATSHTPLAILNNVDLDETMAWKNGKFSFNKADIKTVMRQLARWYDLDVEYRDGLTKDFFGGDMQRDLPLSKVLEFLRKSQIHFEVEGKKVVVMP